MKIGPKLQASCKAYSENLCKPLEKEEKAEEEEEKTQSKPGDDYIWMELL